MNDGYCCGDCYYEAMQSETERLTDDNAVLRTEVDDARNLARGLWRADGYVDPETALRENPWLEDDDGQT